MEELKKEIEARTIFLKLKIVDPGQRIPTKSKKYESEVDYMYNTLNRMSDVRMMPELLPDDRLQRYLLKRFKEKKQRRKSVVVEHMNKQNFEKSIEKMTEMNSSYYKARKESKTDSLSRSSSVKTYNTRGNNSATKSNNLSPLIHSNSVEKIYSGLYFGFGKDYDQMMLQKSKSKTKSLFYMPSSNTSSDNTPLYIPKPTNFNLSTPEHRAKLFKNVLHKRSMKVNIKKEVINNILTARGNNLPTIQSHRSTSSEKDSIINTNKKNNVLNIFNKIYNSHVANNELKSRNVNQHLELHNMISK
jgi:hypothetical protein